MLKHADKPPGLVVFDCDGTLVDSQHMILKAMRVAFAASGLESPRLEAVRRVVGLSLTPAIAELVPAAEAALVPRMVEDYKGAFHDLRAAGGHAQEPLFPGIREALDALERAGYRMGIATGKSARGLGKILELNDIARYFVTVQTADNHPSKPHPAMLEAAMAEAGMDAGATVLVGDTSYDMTMAVAAHVAALGVDWGYHPAAELSGAGASRIARAAGEIPALVEEMLTLQGAGQGAGQGAERR